MRRIACWKLLVVSSFIIISFSSKVSAQNTDTPDVIRNVVAEVELGIQMNGGV